MALTYPSDYLQYLPASIQITIFERMSPKDSTPKEIITLYMPEELRIPSTVRWGETNLGAIGAGIATYRDSGSVTSGLVVGGGKAALGGVIKLGNDAANWAAQKLGMSYDAEGASNAISVMTGKTLNPYLTAIFQGVDFRNFSYRFKFSPHSEADCQVIDDIIKTLRKSALPDNAASDMVFNYPDEFEIKYFFNKQEHPWLKKIKRSILTDIDVHYGAGDQWSQHRNGFPTVITMDLRFKEVVLVLRKDVEEGY